MSEIDVHVAEYKSLLKEFAKTFFSYFEKGRAQAISCKEKILICGMGGSAISGDYLRTVLSYYSDCEVVVSKSYEPPNFVDETWSVFVISYSGNTEETLSQAKILLDRGIKIAVISSGGILGNLAKENNLPFFKVEEGLQPRAALPNLFGILLGAVYDSFSLPLNLDIILPELEQHVNMLHSQEPFMKNLAFSLVSRSVFVISSTLFGSVGLRFRCQLNENSKLHAANFESPEFSHNAIIGFDGKGADVFFIILRSKYEHPRTKLHLDFLENHYRDSMVSLEAEGDSLLTQILSITAFLDYFSVVAAEIQEIDPYTITSINLLKSELKSK